MRVLFLDCDGVVNHWAWWAERAISEPGARKSRDPLARRISDCDPAAVARLNRIVERTRCVVVLSSTWRKDNHGLSITERALQARGANFPLVDATPDCARATAGVLFIGAERGAEIQEWLDRHPTVTRFAIVDDDSDMGPLLPRLVKTSMERGIQDEHVERLIALLEEP